MTRRRYDRAFVAFFILCIPLGCAGWWATDNPSYLALPLVTILLWLPLRFTISRAGHVERRIAADPEVRDLLVVWGLVFVVLIGWLSWREKNSPLEWLDIAFAVTAFGVFVAFVARADLRRHKQDVLASQQSLLDWQRGEMQRSECTTESGGD